MYQQINVTKKNEWIENNRNSWNATIKSNVKNKILFGGKHRMRSFARLGYK